MSGGIGIFITSHADGAGIGRQLTISGTFAPFSGGITSMSASFNGAGAGGQLTHSNSGWSWTGLVPNSVRPGQSATFTVSVWGVLRGPPDKEGTPTSIEADGSRSVTLNLEYVVPVLTVDPFQSPMVTADPTYPFRLSGTLSEAGAPYVATIAYQVGSTTGTLNNPRGAWHVDLPLAPGTYPITVTASDNFASSTTFNSTLTVLRYDKSTAPVAPPGVTLPQTLAGIPTTASVTSWTRLEPQVTGSDIDVTTRARLFDPLWLMTRQWQVGEFQGEDTGSPVQVRARATNATISRYHPGELSQTSTQSLPYRPNQAPLEALVERRAMRPAGPSSLQMLPMAVDAGLHFLRLLELNPTGAKYRAAFLAKYAMPGLDAATLATTDPDTARFVSTMAGRAPDARQLAAALAGAQAAGFQFDPALGIAAGDVAAIQSIVGTWLGYYGSLFSEPAGPTDNAWTPSRLEYAVSISTRLSAQPQDQLTLSANEFGGGRLDWSSFDVNNRFSVDTTGDTPFTSIVSLAIPAPVTVKGAPAQRFWELEDAKVAYGLLSAGPTDLAHMMMIEYASSYGNDWFVTALTVPVGSVTRVDSLVVTDSFGVRNLLRPIGDPALPPAFFSMWQPSRRRYAGDPKPVGVSNAFFFPPSIGTSLDGGALEEVLFLRDEMANMAWGVERSIEGGLGTSVSLANTAPPPPDPAPHYVLAALPPDNWVPLMPVQVDSMGTVQLRRASTVQLDGSTKPKAARSRVLNAATPLSIYDEEVPREGARITQQRRLARWIDGSTWVWTAFRNDVGSGEGSAGLVFDQIGDGDPPS